jgi:predicted phosphodiesterase
MTQPLRSEIVIDALKRFPDAPSLTLAKKIYKENKNIFKDVDSVRSIVRRFRGQKGANQRKASPDKQHFKTRGKFNPFDKLPKGIKCMSEAKYYTIKGKKTLILSDAHIPYHEKEPLQIALEYGRDAEVDTILLNGDFWDCYMLSTFTKDIRKRSVAKELKTVHEILDIIIDNFPNAKIIYKLGNHEDRWENFLKVKAPELLDLKISSYDEILGTEYRNIDIARKGTIMRIGALNIVHGHEFGRSVFSPVNAARGVFLRGHECCLLGHYHQSSNHTESSMNDNVVSCWSVGCLCDLRPEYKPINIKWQHGFAIVESLGGKEFAVSNKKIIKGKVY